jgi:hypothetical protein
MESLVTLFEFVAFVALVLSLPSLIREVRFLYLARAVVRGSCPSEQVLGLGYAEGTPLMVSSFGASDYADGQDHHVRTTKHCKKRSAPKGPRSQRDSGRNCVENR